MSAETKAGAGVREPKRDAKHAGAAPWRLAVWVLVIIFLAETLVVAFLEIVRPGSTRVPGFVDAGLLVLISALFLWWVIGRRLFNEASAADARAAAIVASAVDGIVTIDDEGIIESANPAAERIFGYSAHELIGQPVTGLMPLRYRDAHRMGLLRARRREEAHLLTKTVELSGLRHDGTEFPLELSLAKWKAGEQTYFTGVVRDITERKRTVDALRESTARYEDLFTQMLNGFGVHEVICDAAGKPCDYRFLAVNPAFENFTGLKAQDVVGKTVREVLPDIEPFWIDTLGQVAITRKPVHFEHASALLNRHYEVFAFSPKPGQFAAVFNDVSDRRQLEAQLQQAQKLEVVGELTSGIAHDFNNILSVILGNAELALGSPDTRGVALDDLQEIQAAAQRGASLVRRLLSFSRESSLTLRPVDLAQLIQDESNAFRRILPESIAVTVRSDPDVSAVSADPAAVEQILLNLVTNARDAMPEGGSLRIAVGASILGEELDLLPPGLAPGEYAWFSVGDSGTGMDEETKARMFEPFFTTKPPGRGTGLGMAMVHGLARQHGGVVQVESQLGKGTTVTVYFPVIHGEVLPPAESRETTPLAAGNGETILIAEDEPALRRATTRTLEALGYRVLAAPDGEEALRLFHEHEAAVRLVLSDMVMPRMGGWDLYRALRGEGKTVRFVGVSGYAAAWGARAGANDAGDLAYLSKPWTMGQLAEVVRHELDRPASATCATSQPATEPVRPEPAGAVI